MKSKKTIVIAAASLAGACSILAACGGGGNNGGDSRDGGSPSIVGSWASEEFSGAFVYTFNQDGTGNYDAAGAAMPFKYTITDNKLSIQYEGYDTPFDTTYTVTDKQLTIKDSLDEDVVYNRK